MSKSKDHMFLVSLTEEKLGIAFCSAEGISKEQARIQVIQVITEHKSSDGKIVNYLGLLDYKEMDLGIEKQLHYFEKYSPVWLLFPETCD